MENDTIQYQGKTIHQKHIVHFCLDCLGEDSRCEECDAIVTGKQIGRAHV